MSSKGFSRFRGLFWRIFSISVLCMLIPMLVSLFTASYFSQKYLGDSASNSLLNIANEKKNQMELALYDIEKQAQSIALQPSIVDLLSKAVSNSSKPDGTGLQRITQNLEDNFDLDSGLFENVFLMYKNKSIADGMGGGSIGWEAKQLKDIVANVTQNVKIMTETSRDFEFTMQEINKVSQEFAANSEGVSASSEEQIALTEAIVSSSKAMADMSEELSGLIRNFRL